MKFISSTGHLPKPEELLAQISELENRYAELFLENGDPEELKKIHLRLEALKQELEQTSQGR